MAEVGEVASQTLKLSGIREGTDTAEARENLCDLANIAGVDLEKAFAKKIEHNKIREW